MYNYLVNAAKERIIFELKTLFKNHPAYSNLEIYNRYPYNERIQEGIIVKNTSASKMALAADNFQGSVYSYVCYANHSNFPGKSLEWVREDESHLAEWRYREDYSDQFTSTNTLIKMNDNMLEGKKDLRFTSDIRNVDVFVNNERVIPYRVDGENKVIDIINIFDAGKLHLGSKVEVSYWYRNLVPSGVYQLEIVSGDPTIHKYQFMVDAVLDREQLLFEKYKGETTVRLDHYPVYPKSLKIKENGYFIDETDPLTGESNYILDENSGIITFTNVTNPILTNSKIEAFYRTQGLSTGPFEISYFNVAVNTAIPGVVLAFGHGVSVGDKQFVIVNRDRILTAQEFSGKWEMSVSLDVYAKDSYKVEELIDLTTGYINAYRKSDLETEGIALTDINFGGESEEVFDEATGDLVYKGSVDYSFLTEWLMHKPLLQTIEGYTLDVFEIPNIYIEPMNKNFEKIR